MDILILLAKFGLLTFSLVYGGRYLVCAFWQKSIGDMHAWMAGVSIAGFITLQWLL